MADVELKIKADVAEAERQINKVKESIKDLGKEKQLAANPLNPSPAGRLSDLGIRPDVIQAQAAVASPAANPTALNNPAKLEFFRQSIDGYKQIGIEAEKAALKANLLNAAASALPPELQAALALTKGITAETTILGASVLSLGGILAAGAVTIVAVKKLTDDIREAAELRLRTEIMITAEFNKQRLAQIEFIKERQKAQEGREFDRFLGSAGTESLKQARAEREKELASLRAQEELRMQINSAALSAVGGFKDKEKGEAFLAQGTGGQQQRIDQLREEIKELDKTLDNTAAKVTSTVTGYSGVIDVAMAHARAVREADERAAVETYKRIEEQKKKMIEEAKRAAKEWAAYVINARETAIDVFGRNSQNPFVQNATDMEMAIDRVRKATERLGGGLTKTLSDLIANRAAANAMAQDIDNRLKAMDLRDRARDLDRGFRRGDEDRIRQEALRQIFPNYSSQEARDEAIRVQMNAIRAQETREQQEDLSRRLALLAGGSRENDQRVIALTHNLDISQLNGRERTQTRDALLREAGNLEGERQESVALIRDLKKIITDAGIKVDLQDQAITNVILESKDLNATKRQRSVYGNPISTADSMNP